MRLSFVVLALVLALGVAANAELVYDSTTSPFFTASGGMARGLDDGFFADGVGGVLVDGVNFAFYVSGTGRVSFTAHLLFYDTLTEDATPVNSDYLGGFSINVQQIDAGSMYATGMVDLSGMGGIFFPDNDWAVDIIFTELGSSTLSDRVTMVFAAGDPAIGYNIPFCWFDDNGDGLYSDTDEWAYFGSDYGAHFYLQLSGTVVPEPSSMLAMAAGVFGLAGMIRRRK